MARRVQAEALSTDLDRASLCAALLEEWYPRNGRRFGWRSWTDEYRVLVTEVLLQRTRAEVVESALPAFLVRYPSWVGLAATSHEELRAILAPLGLSDRRAASLRGLAQMMAGRIAPIEYEQLPGVGQYIGRSTRVSLHASREAMVDANFVRVLRRVFVGPWMADYRHDRRLQRLALAVIETAGDPRVTNWAMLDLGATVCVPGRPRCGECPLAAQCPVGRGEAMASSPRS
jgi:A/G-specific adenine glycosylase